VIGIDSSPRFNSIRAQYREFAITGVRIELLPLVTVPTYDTRFVGETFKMLPGDKPHTVFRNNRPLAHSENSPWF